MIEVYRTEVGGVYEIDRARHSVRSVEHPETRRILATWVPYLEANTPRVGTPLVITWGYGTDTYARAPLAIGNVRGEVLAGLLDHVRQLWTSPVAAIGEVDA